MNNKIQKLPPFIKFCYTIGMIPTSYKVSMSYQEQLEWLCDFLENTVIPTVNNNGQAVEELQALYVQLKEYVDNYFENLDVQTEINNKLDAMALSGELAEIINQEIFGQLDERITQNSNDIDDLEEEIDKIKSFYVNVTGEGIKNDGTDVSTELQELIDSYPAGTTFFFNNGTYNFKNIALKSNTTILGNTDTNFVVDDDDICKQFIIDTKSNIEIKNCNFRNGTTNEQNLIGGAVANQKASIFMNLSNNIKIQNCNFNIISGVAFIYALDTEYVYIEKCHFNHSAYAMIEKISNCKHWYINENLFENLYTGSTDNSYAIASGVLDYESDSGFTEDIHITNNVFKNHIGWETIDSHGGRDYYIENNQFYECYQPIAIFDDQRVARTFDMRNINVIGNYIECNGTIDNWKSNCISVRGNSLTGKLCKAVTIKNNKVISKNLNAISGFNCRYIDGFILEGNYTYGIHNPILTLVNIINGNIDNNTFENTPFTNNVSRTRDFQITNIYNVSMQGNTNISLWQPNYVLDIQGQSYIKNYEKNDWHYVTNIVNSIARLYKYGKLGDLRINQATMYRNARATNKNLQSSAATNVCTFKTTSGSNVVETSVDALSVLSIGENVTLVGAGPNNEDIQAVFTEYIDNTHIKLDINMYQTANAIQVNTLDATWINLPVSSS